MGVSSNKITIYQCAVHGYLADFNGEYRHFSKQVFRTREAAEAYMPKFIERCKTKRDEYDWFVLGKIIKSKVVELELNVDYE